MPNTLQLPLLLQIDPPNIVHSYKCRFRSLKQSLKIISGCTALQSYMCALIHLLLNGQFSLEIFMSATLTSCSLCLKTVNIFLPISVGGFAHTSYLSQISQIKPKIAYLEKNDKYEVWPCLQQCEALCGQTWLGSSCHQYFNSICKYSSFHQYFNSICKYSSCHGRLS